MFFRYRSGIAGSYASFIPSFKGISITSSIVAVWIYIPTSSVGGLLFIHTFSSTIFVDFFIMAIFSGVSWGFPDDSEVKASACNVGDLDSIPGSGRSPGEENGNPLQYSCLENPMNGGALWVHRVTKSGPRLSNFTFNFNNEWCWAFLHLFISHLCVFFGETFV